VFPLPFLRRNRVEFFQFEHGKSAPDARLNASLTMRRQLCD
jgi:hypothetical protein